MEQIPIDMELQEFDKVIRHACSISGARLSILNECSVDKYGTIVFEIQGGMNGALYGINEWKHYFECLAKFSDVIEELGFDLWCLNVDNDAIDDLFTAKFGIRKKK